MGQALYNPFQIMAPKAVIVFSSRSGVCVLAVFGSGHVTSACIRGTLTLGTQRPCREEAQDSRRVHTWVLRPIASAELVSMARHVREDASR